MGRLLAVRYVRRVSFPPANPLPGFPSQTSLSRKASCVRGIGEGRGGRYGSGARGNEVDWVGRDGLQRVLFLIGGKVLVKDCWLHRRSKIQTNSLDLFLSSVFSVWAIASPVLQIGRESKVSSQQPTRQRRERQKNMTDVYLRPDMGTVQSTLVSFDSRGIPILASRHGIDIVFYSGRRTVRVRTRLCRPQGAHLLCLGRHEGPLRTGSRRQPRRAGA